MGIDIGNKWIASQKDKCKVDKENAEKLSECAGLKGIPAVTNDINDVKIVQQLLYNANNDVKLQVL